MKLEQGFIPIVGDLPGEESGEHVFCVARWRGGSRGTVIFCPGLGVSMSEPRYFLTELAKRAVAAGFNSLQFDYPGQGDSPAAPTAALWLYLRAFWTMHGLAAERGGIIGAIGYGLGNLIAIDCTKRCGVDRCVMLAPRMPAWDIALAVLRAAGGNDLHFLPDWSDGDAAQTVWRAVVGEPVVPSQPCAPLPRMVVVGAFQQAMRALTLDCAMSTCVVSDDRCDDCGANFVFLEHAPTAEKPSWHWDAAARRRASEGALAWIGQAGPAVRPRPSKRMADSTELRPSCQDGVQRVDAITFGDALGLVHRPIRPNRSDICFVYEQGIPGDRVDIHGCGPRFSTAAALAGYASFRYDGSGTGLSEGVFETVTWSGRNAEHAAALELLRSRYGFRRFVIVGNSAGARVALHSANSSAEVLGAILWGPILIEATRRTGVGRPTRLASGELATEYCGLWLGIGYNIDERRHDFCEQLRCCRKPLLIVFAADEQNQANLAGVGAIAAALPAASVERAEGLHGFSPTAIDQVIQRSIIWTRERFG